MAQNRSYETDGQDDPTRYWLRLTVRVKTHPEWGLARVMRWYPAAAGFPQRLRVMPEKVSAPQVVSITDVEVVST